MTKTTNLWRFQRPIKDRCLRLLYAGPHFQASLGLTRASLARRNLLGNNNTNGVQLIHCPTDEDLWKHAPLADVAVPFMQKFDSQFLNRCCSSNLRLVMQFGVGLEGVDVEAATRLGIAVSNIPAAQSGNAQATAEHAILLILTMLRRTIPGPTLKERFQKGVLGGTPVPRSLFRKRVTVVGYGAVGSTICDYLMAMGAQVTTVRQNQHKPLLSNHHPGIIQVSTSLENTLPTTDIVVLACPLTPQTKYMINEDTLKLLPPNSIVVNVGRGPLVSHTAILHALNSEEHPVVGYASDVGVGVDVPDGSSFPSKPSEPWDPHDELSRHPHALFTPHVGGYTDYSYGIMTESILDAVECVRRGEPPPVWVNA